MKMWIRRIAQNLKNSALSIQGRIFQIFRSYFGQCDDFIFSFWNLLTFSVTYPTRLLSTYLKNGPLEQNALIDET